MIVAFDLDDTLYRELDYVESGFEAVAQLMSNRYGVASETVLEIMYDSLAQKGRGSQFDDMLRAFDLFTVTRRNEMIRCYRSHLPRLLLPAETRDVLMKLTASQHRLFLVTDGHSRVQANKIQALGLNSFFEHCYITWRYGRSAQKPSQHCFRLLLKRSGASSEELVYVGDNPRKDFIGVRSIGGTTIRVRTGPHAEINAVPDYDADIAVRDIGEVPRIVKQLSHRRSR